MPVACRPTGCTATVLRGKGGNAGFIRIKPELARMIEFRPFNLMGRGWNLGEPFDMVFCPQRDDLL